MAIAKIYTTDYCPYCVRAKKLLQSKGATIEEIDITTDTNLRNEIMKKTGMKTVPQIFIGDEFIGGFSELSALDSDGKLDNKLNK